MPQGKFSRNTAIVSHIIIIIWLALQLLASIFQKSLLADAMPRGSSEMQKVNSWAVIVLCIGGLVIIAANFMICMQKSKKAPLIMSSVTAGLLPIAVRITNTVQFISLNNKDGIESLQSLSVYSNHIVYPLSYILYVGAVVTIAAAAVYAFRGSETFPRKVSIASQIVIIVWTALQLLSSIFQKFVLHKLLGLNEQMIESAGKVNSYGAIAFCVGGFLILLANFLICVKKGRLSPLLIASITTGLLPFAAGWLMNTQIILASFDGMDAFYVVSDYNVIVNILSYLLYVGAVLAIAAGAAYIFSKGEKSVTEESAEVYEFE